MNKTRADLIMDESHKFLIENLYKEGLKHFGKKNVKFAQEVAETWHNHKSYVWRWKEAETFGNNKGKILDMASGVGTFVFHGLEKGYDVYGIEPEKWKHHYISKKIKELNLPLEWRNRFIEGVGENLPFKDSSFDYIVSYQTLEHVQDVNKCLDEMLRVLKPGGKLKIHAPDYNCYYEPHYLIPFLPQMNRNLAKIYLKILRKPTSGLDSLNWITSKKVISHLSEKDNIDIIDLYATYKTRKLNKIKNKLKIPNILSIILNNLINYKKVYTAREEKHINLVINKHE